MTRRRRILQPGSGWRSSNLSPYDEDLRTPAHIRHQARLEVEGSQSPLDTESRAHEDSNMDTGAPSLDDEAVDTQGEGGMLSQNAHVDRSTDFNVPYLHGADANPTSDSENSNIKEATKSWLDELSPLPRNGAPPSSPRPKALDLPQPLPGLEHPDPNHSRDDNELAFSDDGGRSVIMDTPGTLWSSPSSPHRPDASQALTLAQASLLFPRRHFQVELYKICSMLRKLVLATADGFAVVDPHDFLEVLSWRHLEPEDRDSLSIIHRLRRLSAARLLIPFFWDGRILLGFVDKEDERTDLFNPDPAWTGAAASADRRDHPTALLESFVGSVWPEYLKNIQPDRPTIHRTAARLEPLDPRLIQDYSGGRPWEIKHVLPIFFEALCLVSQVPWNEEPFSIYNSSILRRLLATFESGRAASVLGSLREESLRCMKLSLLGPLEHAVARAQAEMWKTFTTEPMPGDVMAAKWRARVQLKLGVEIGRLACLRFAEQHAQLSQIMQALRAATMKATGNTVHGCLDKAIMGVNDPTRISPRGWGWGIRGLIDLEGSLGRMESELEYWRMQYRAFLCHDLYI